MLCHQDAGRVNTELETANNVTPRLSVKAAFYLSDVSLDCAPTCKWASPYSATVPPATNGALCRDCARVASADDRGVGGVPAAGREGPARWRDSHHAQGGQRPSLRSATPYAS